MNNLLDRSILRCVNFVCDLWGSVKSARVPRFTSPESNKKRLNQPLGRNSHKQKFSNPIKIYKHALPHVLSQVTDDVRPNDDGSFGYRRISYRGPDSIKDESCHLIVDPTILEFFVIPCSTYEFQCFYGYYLGYLSKYEMKRFGDIKTHVHVHGRHLLATLDGSLVTYRDSSLLEFDGSNINEPSRVTDFTKTHTILQYEENSILLFVDHIMECKAYRPEVDDDKLAIIIERYFGAGQSRYLTNPVNIRVTGV